MGIYFSQKNRIKKKEQSKKMTIKVKMLKFIFVINQCTKFLFF